MEVLKLLIGNNLDLNNAKLKIVHLYPDLPIDILPHLLYYHSFYHLYLSPYLSTSSISLSTCVHTHKGKVCTSAKSKQAASDQFRNVTHSLKQIIVC